MERNRLWVMNVHLDKLILGDIVFINGILGKPQTNGTYSPELERLAMVGIYKWEGDVDFRAVALPAFYGDSFYCPLGCRSVFKHLF